MGFSDHPDGNNIMIDAVITTQGSSNLSKGTFSVTKFALGDAEVNYWWIRHFGRSIGREKCEKNTVMFEANRRCQVESTLMSSGTPFLTHLPRLATKDGDKVPPTKEIGRSALGKKKVSTLLEWQQVIPDGAKNFSDNVDWSYRISMPTYITCPSLVPYNVTNGIAHYNVVAQSNASSTVGTTKGAIKVQALATSDAQHNKSAENGKRRATVTVNSDYSGQLIFTVDVY